MADALKILVVKLDGLDQIPESTVVLQLERRVGRRLLW